MKVNIFELKEMEEDELLELALQTITSFPVLKEIYDEDFLRDLVRRRHHFDNYLLWLLVSKQPFTYSTWQIIANCLKSLKDSDGSSHFKAKLRSRTDRVFRRNLNMQLTIKQKVTTSNWSRRYLTLKKSQNSR